MPPSRDRHVLPGSELYDAKGVVERYFAPRRPSESPIVTMEMPAFWDAAADVAGLTILDLGCGDGELGQRLLERGAARYIGVDASERMVALAVDRLEPARAGVVRADITKYRPPRSTFDLIVSLRVVHYVADLTGVLRRARHALRPNGRVIYSVEHPLITSFEAREPDARRASWTVDNYFVAGDREVEFLGRRVRKYHRTIEEHLDAVRYAGLELTRLRECAPVRERFGEDEREFERRLRIPLFLLIEARRPS